MPDADTPTNRPRKRTWLHRVRTVVLCLIAGAIINVLVAWGCVFFQLDIKHKSERRAHADELALVAKWSVSADETRGINPIRVSIRKSPGVVSRSIGILRDDPTEVLFGSDLLLVDQRAGWPMLSLWCGWQDVFHDSGVNYHNWWGLDLAKEGESHDNLWFPLRPLLLGTVVNTAIFACTVWFIVLVAIELRSRRRQRRGVCPACAYDLRGAKHEVCPECGKAVG